MMEKYNLFLYVLFLFKSNLRKVRYVTLKIFFLRNFIIMESGDQNMSITEKHRSTFPKIKTVQRTKINELIKHNLVTS